MTKPKNFIALLLLPLATCFVAPRATADEQDTAGGIPAEHRLLYEKLSQTATLPTDEMSVEKALDALSKSIGAPIAFESETENFEYGKLRFDESMTHRKAIEYLALALGWTDAEISFHDRGILVLDRDDGKERPILRCYDLSFFSDYTTAKRLRLIEQIRAEVAPETWDKPGGGWIVASPDVFSIDVYQSWRVHEDITAFFYDAHDSHVAATLFTAETMAKKEAELEHFFFSQMLRHSDRGELSSEFASEVVEKFRAIYPFRSLTSRLQKLEKPSLHANSTISVKAERTLALREEDFGREGWREINWASFREASLKKLHEAKVEDFVRREGFGFTRIDPPGPSHLRLQLTPRLALPSTDSLPTSGDDSPVRIPQSDLEAATTEPHLPTQDLLSAFHMQGEANFLSPMRFGHFKDRDHVAGFEPHAFTDVPRMKDVDGKEWDAVRTEQWAVRRLELVSLLNQEKPAVYISDQLPRMDEFGDAPTRDLSDFEASALQALIQGKDVIARATTNRIEMVGSLRAIKQCTTCHDAQRGQLLGAFSYDLIRDPALVTIDHDNPVPMNVP